MKPALLQKSVTAVAIFAGLMHIFCCVLPLVMTTLGIGSTLGVIGINATQLEVLHRYEHEIFAFSAAMLIVAGLSQCTSWRIDCRVQGSCDHKPCSPTKRLSFKLFVLASLIFLVNMAVFLSVPHNH